MSTRVNYEIITQIIEEGSKVLDLGCGDGTLLQMLNEEKNIKGTGIEINQETVVCALEKGLSIIQGDLDQGLKEFPTKEYDYAVLNQTLQSTEKPDYVIKEMLRVSKSAIVSFPNFAYWKVRLYLLMWGKMPKSERLPYEWFDTPNIHLLTIGDFFEFCYKNDITILDSIFLNKGKIEKRPLPNFFCEEAIFVISK